MQLQVRINKNSAESYKMMLYIFVNSHLHMQTKGKNTNYGYIHSTHVYIPPSRVKCKLFPLMSGKLFPWKPPKAEKVLITTYS